MDDRACLVGTSVSTGRLREEIATAARSDAKVLVLGETGVGKEVVAQLIHRQSRRNRSPLVTVNCAGIPDTLLESDMFGHVRGSFTDAHRDKAGRLETAHGGTVFLDEVGEMSLRMQALLLRFLETGEIQRVGADSSQRTLDVRVIAATNRNLRDEVATKAFREDLYYRLNVVLITIPPLRERRDDIPALTEHFLRLYAQAARVAPLAMSREAMERLVAYDWPGNVRELRNLVERLMARVRTAVVQPEHVRGLAPADAAPSNNPPSIGGGPDANTLYERMTRGGESFWTVIYEPFVAHDLRRDDLRAIVQRGLEQTRGNYKLLIPLYNMRETDYKRFLQFLRKHQCHLPFQPFRALSALRATRSSGVAS